MQSRYPAQLGGEISFPLLLPHRWLSIYTREKKDRNIDPGMEPERNRNSRKVSRMFAIVLHANLTAQLRGGVERAIMCALSKNYIFFGRTLPKDFAFYFPRYFDPLKNISWGQKVELRCYSKRARARSPVCGVKV